MMRPGNVFNKLPKFCVGLKPALIWVRCPGRKGHPCGRPHHKYFGPKDRDEAMAELEFLRRELELAAAITAAHGTPVPRVRRSKDFIAVTSPLTASRRRPRAPLKLLASPSLRSVDAPLLHLQWVCRGVRYVLDRLRERAPRAPQPPSTMLSVPDGIVVTRCRTYSRHGVADGGGGTTDPCGR
jgi:hypothetical protein